MIVRTYGRRNRGISRGYSGSMDDDDGDSILDPYGDSLSSQEAAAAAHQDFYAFSSQDSTAPHLPSYYDDSDPDPFGQPLAAEDCLRGDGYGGGGGVSRKSKKPRNGEGKRGKGYVEYSVLRATSTLMETQEFGEMMEHVDEVNFALDGLRKGQPVRIRRASLLSLLGICGTAQQRRLLRTQGMAKTIINALIGLNFDDSPSDLAAATLFYLLTGDGQDDQLLESPSCINFLVKMLKPIVSASTEDKVSQFGFKLLGLRKDPEIFHGGLNKKDNCSANIISRVKEILVSCKELKPSLLHDSGIHRPELSPKWIALLTMEKASLSTIALEESSGIVRKTGGNFKEKLREFGGLDAVFEVSMHCYSTMEGWREQHPSFWDAKNDVYLSSLVLLLKCLKIMENATFLSNDNQTHLLEMRGNLDPEGSNVSFTKLIINAIKILSGLYLLKSSPAPNSQESEFSNGIYHTSQLALVAADKEESNEILSVRSTRECCSVEETSLQKISGTSVPPRYSSSSSEMTTSSNGSSLLKIKFSSSASSSRGGLLKSSTSGTNSTSNGLKSNFSYGKRDIVTDDAMFESLEHSQDPFAFDEDEFEPSKWELLSGKKHSKSKNSRLPIRNAEDVCQLQLKRLEDLDKGERRHQESSSCDNNCSQEASTSGAIDEENRSFLTDCLLTAVKVLMNLTNDNPLGCKQIAACGGLETMVSVIAGHFPMFSSSSSLFSDRKEKNHNIGLDHEKEKHLTDQELDFLVAILGLLVNLVEKDGSNRSRLATTSVTVPNLEGLESGSRRDVIPLLCSIFLANRGGSEPAGEEQVMELDDEALLQGEKEAEKMIVEAYSALLLAFLSTESKSIRDEIAACLPQHNLAVLVPVLERFVAFHLTLDMMTPETHKTVSEVIESCRVL
ncbi:wings apart-like protein 2 [Syzygium oleosum]|uniref:wings apart-like protein 2 n=1 Tax=Syzygium oleosum TaxID=219896 RepID=UPI0024BB6124|nr:wings apart-like protein 2 [Syzygium oleosum]